jgi:hypothetical protein
MRDDVMAEEIKIRAAFEFAAFGALQNLAVKFTCSIKIADGKRKMEKRGGHGMSPVVG